MNHRGTTTTTKTLKMYVDEPCIHLPATVLYKEKHHWKMDNMSDGNGNVSFPIKLGSILSNKKCFWARGGGS